MMIFRILKIVCIVTAFGPLQAQARAAEAYPNQTMKIVVPFAPGGGVDAVAAAPVEGV